MNILQSGLDKAMADNIFDSVRQAALRPGDYVKSCFLQPSLRDPVAIGDMIRSSLARRAKLWFDSQGYLFIKVPNSLHESVAWSVGHLVKAAAAFQLYDTGSTSCPGYGDGDFGFKPDPWPRDYPPSVQGEVVATSSLTEALAKGYMWFFLHDYAEYFILIIADEGTQQWPVGVAPALQQTIATPGQLSVTVYSRAMNYPNANATLAYPLAGYVPTAPGAAAPVAPTVDQTIHIGRVDENNVAPGAGSANYATACNGPAVVGAPTHHLVLDATAMKGATHLASIAAWSIPWPAGFPAPTAVAGNVVVDLGELKRVIYARFRLPNGTMPPMP
eukprot:TRINITY_DN1714_c0_g1_i5.p1 TRINITY_DN1714_c0_g1~~TRINITY_DN1714_c0_g1_i5.p1  ORF type:complete len:331 (+),score=54.22 TRINITY_DN1714_c0_g1_i5:217-1209(+)